MQEQPVLVIVDGTGHLISRGEGGKGARYPDAYQGYLNQMIAINDALGFSELKYEMYGKSDEDMDRLRTYPEFQQTVRVYESVKPKQDIEPYRFTFWNPENRELSVRSQRKSLGTVDCFDPSRVYGPTMIFCNAVMTHESLPEALQQNEHDFEHQPAYFDDSGMIIQLEFAVNQFGVRYVNNLEEQVRASYGSQESDRDPAIMKAVQIPPNANSRGEGEGY